MLFIVVVLLLLVVVVRVVVVSVTFLRLTPSYRLFLPHLLLHFILLACPLIRIVVEVVEEVVEVVDVVQVVSDRGPAYHTIEQSCSYDRPLMS